MSIPKLLHWLGLIACITLVISCFMPWTFYPDINKTFTGFFSEQNMYGKPGVFLVPIAVGSLIFMLLPKLWAKRINIFWAALGLGYAVKAYINFASCYGAGYCPEKKAGIYLMIFSAILILAAAIFPDVDMNENL
jgi:hypothetical protein